MKTFKDLIFKKHYLAIEGIDIMQHAKEAVLKFDNKWAISVCCGSVSFCPGVMIDHSERGDDPFAYYPEYDRYFEGMIISPDGHYEVFRGQEEDVEDWLRAIQEGHFPD